MESPRSLMVKVSFSGEFILRPKKSVCVKEQEATLREVFFFFFFNTLDLFVQINHLYFLSFKCAGNYNDRSN